MRYVFLLDQSRCIACGACAIACMDQNDVFPENGDTPYRNCFVSERGHGMDTKMTYLSLGCMHCSSAPCVQSCPTGCLRKDEGTGFTLYDNSNCIGCHSCAMACPFAAPCYGEDGKMVKCDGCVERVRLGMDPACVRVCPFGAIQLIPEEEYELALKEGAVKAVCAALMED